MNESEREREPSESEKQVEVVVNPHVKLTVQVNVRRRDQGTTHLDLSDRESLRLVRWLIDQLDEGAAGRPDGAQLELELEPRQLKEAFAAGLLMFPDQLAGEAPPFKCDLDPALIDLVPRALLDQARSLAADRRGLRGNPGAILQPAPELPPSLAGTVQMGPELWAHLQLIRLRHRAHDGLSRERPVLWVPQGACGVLQPVWGAGPLTFERVEAALARDDLGDLSDEEVLLLVLAEVLLPAGPPAEPAPPATSRGYFLLGRVISALHIAAARRHFRVMRQEGYYETDREQVIDRRHGMYCEAACMALQRALAPAIGRATGRDVLPSYTWVMRYGPGAELERHIDRPQCRWNVSICMDTESDGPDTVDWPLYFEVDGAAHGANLQMGEAVLYSGTDTPHWRDPLGPNQAVTMLFLHYVNQGWSGSFD